MGDMDLGNGGSDIQSTSRGSVGGGGDDQEFQSRDGQTMSTSLASFDQLYSDNNIIGNTNNNLGIAPSIISTYSSLDNANNNNWTGLNDQQITTSATLPYQPQTMDRQRSSGAARNPRKRSRTSRRTPTTVLNTDTSNFRQMVQEFTGIPGPSIGADSSAYSGMTRLDLFRGPGMRFPPYLARPLPQRINNPMVTIQSHLQRPSSSTAVERLQISGFQPGWHDPIMTSLRPKAPQSFVNEFALGHDYSFTTVTATATATASASASAAMSAPDITSANVAMVVNAAPLGNHRGGTRGEAMVDPWICSSD